MSDPVTNVEIEDVLSSIRRLVSTDDRAPQDEAQAQAEQDAEPAAEDKSSSAEALVLTPALRVSGSQGAAPGQAGEDSAAPTAPDAQEEADDTPHAEAESWHDDSAEQPEDESAELDDTAEADDGSPDPEDGSAQEGADAAPEEPQDNADHWQDDDDDDAAEALSDRVAGFEEAVAARDDEWEPDGDATGDDNAAAPTEPFSWQDEIEDAELVSPTEGLEPFVADEDEFAPEAAAPQPEPRAPSEPEPAEENGFLAAEDPLSDDEAVLDEDALRDLVTEIVRQELQGSLGERITRNVRKLVRREIHRALATKELE